MQVRSSRREAFSSFEVARRKAQKGEEERTGLRKFCFELAEKKLFQVFVGVLIFLNLVQLGTADYRHDNSRVARYSVFLAIFTLEAGVKIVAYGACSSYKKAHLRSTWNICESIIITSGWVGVGYPDAIELYALTALLAMRFVRWLRTSEKIPILRLLVVSITDAIPMIGKTLLLAPVLFSVFGLLGIQLFQGKFQMRCVPKDGFLAAFSNSPWATALVAGEATRNCEFSGNLLTVPTAGTMKMGVNHIISGRTCPSYFECVFVPASQVEANFDSFWTTSLLVFRLIAQDGWSSVAQQAMDAVGDVCYVYFLLIIILGAVLFRALIVAVILAKFEQSCASLFRHQAEIEVLGALEFQDIVQEIIDGELPSTQWVGLDLHEACFSGEDLIDFWLESERESSRSTAVALAKRMVQVMALKCLGGSKTFVDKSSAFYCLRSPEDDTDLTAGGLEYARLVKELQGELKWSAEHHNAVSETPQEVDKSRMTRSFTHESSFTTKKFTRRAMRVPSELSPSPDAPISFSVRASMVIHRSPAGSSRNRKAHPAAAAAAPPANELEALQGIPENETKNLIKIDERLGSLDRVEAASRGSRGSRSGLGSFSMTRGHRRSLSKALWTAPPPPLPAPPGPPNAPEPAKGGKRGSGRQGEHAVTMWSAPPPFLPSPPKVQPVLGDEQAQKIGASVTMGNNVPSTSVQQTDKAMSRDSTQGSARSQSMPVIRKKKALTMADSHFAVSPAAPDFTFAKLQPASPLPHTHSPSPLPLLSTTASNAPKKKAVNSKGISKIQQMLLGNQEEEIKKHKETQEKLKKKKCTERVCVPRLTRVVTNSLFDRIFLVIIVVNTIALASEHHGQTEEMHDKFNVFDFLIVAASLVEVAVIMVSNDGSPIGDSSKSLSSFRILRLFRLFRIIKITKYWGNLRKIMNVLYNAMKPTAWILTLIFFIMVVFASIGVTVFGEQPEFQHRFHLASFPNALLSMFLVLVASDWNVFVYHTATNGANRVSSEIFFTSFMIGIVFIASELILIVILQNFAKDDIKRMKQAQEKEKERSSKARNSDGGTKTPMASASGGGGSQDEAIGQYLKERESLNKTTLKYSTSSVGQARASVLITKDKKLSIYASQSHTEGGPSRDKACCCLSRSHGLRRLCVHMAMHRHFDTTVNLVVIAHLVVSAAAGPWAPFSSASDTAFALYACDCVSAGIYVLEIVVVSLAFGFMSSKKGTQAFLNVGWNRFELLLTLAALFACIPSANGFVYFMAVVGRCLRPLRLIRRLKFMRVSTQALVASLPALGNIAALVAVFWTLFAILGMGLWQGVLFRCSDRSVGSEAECVGTFVGTNGVPKSRLWQNQYPNFDSFGSAMAGLFVVSTADGWNYWAELCASAPDSVGSQPDETSVTASKAVLSYLYAVTFLLISRFFFIQIVVGVVYTNFVQVKAKAEKANNLNPTQKNWVKAQQKLLEVRYIKKYPPPGNNSLSWRLCCCFSSRNAAVLPEPNNRPPVRTDTIRRGGGFGRVEGRDRTSAQRSLDKAINSLNQFHSSGGRGARRRSSISSFEEKMRLNPNLNPSKLLRFRWRLHGLVTNPVFDKVALGLIAASVLVESTRHLLQADGWRQLQQAGDICFSVLFSVELVLRLAGVGAVEFFRASKLNLVDPLVVLALLVKLAVTHSNLDISGWGANVLQGLIILRIFRAVNLVAGLRELSVMLRNILPFIFRLFGLQLVFTVGLATLAMDLYGRIPLVSFWIEHMDFNGGVLVPGPGFPFNTGPSVLPEMGFRNIFDSVRSILRVGLLDGWGSAMYLIANSHNTGACGALGGGDPTTLAESVLSLSTMYEIDAAASECPSFGLAFSAYFFFPIAIVLLYFFFLNLTTSVVLENFFFLDAFTSGSTIVEAAVVRDFVEVWSFYDQFGNGEISAYDLPELLRCLAPPLSCGVGVEIARRHHLQVLKKGGGGLEAGRRGMPEFESNKEKETRYGAALKFAQQKKTETTSHHAISDPFYKRGHINEIIISLDLPIQTSHHTAGGTISFHALLRALVRRLIGQSTPRTMEVEVKTRRMLARKGIQRRRQLPDVFKEMQAEAQSTAGPSAAIDPRVDQQVVEKVHSVWEMYCATTIQMCWWRFKQRKLRRAYLKAANSSKVLRMMGPQLKQEMTKVWIKQSQEHLLLRRPIISRRFHTDTWIKFAYAANQFVLTVAPEHFLRNCIPPKQSSGGPAAPVS